MRYVRSLFTEYQEHSYLPQKEVEKMDNNNRFRPTAINRGRVQFVVAAVCIIALASSIYGQSGGTFQISPSTITGGGNTTANGTMSATGSIGQSPLGSVGGGP